MESQKQAEIELPALAKDCSFQHQALYWVVYFVAIEIQCREDSLFPKVDGINVDCL